MRIAWGIFCLTMASWAIGQPPQKPEPLPHYSASQSLREDATLRSVAFTTPQIGLTCGDRGTILRTVDGGSTWQAVHSGVDCPLSAIIWVDTNQAVAVGGNYDRITGISRGVVLLSRNGGQSWQRADDTELTRFHHLEKNRDGSIVAHCDWSHAILTDRLISRDGGRTWNDHASPQTGTHTVQSSSAAKAAEHRSATSQHSTTTSPSLNELMQWFQVTQIPVAIRGACRITNTDYCIVGDHGVILTTKDKGKTWVTNRGKARQTSVLFVANSAKTAAWSMLGSEALESRNRVSLLVRETQTESSTGSHDHALANQVAVMLGAAGADMIGNWGNDLNQTALAWIGIHQPTVLVLDETLPVAVRDAFVNAAASAAIQRVAIYGFESKGGTALHRDALLAHCGALAGDLHADAMHYFAPNDIQLSSTTLRYPYDISPNQRRGSSVTNGLSLPRGHLLSGKTPDASRHQLQILKARLQQADRLQSLVNTSKDPIAFNESIASLLDQTAKFDQFRVAWSIIQATRPDQLSQGLALHEAALSQFATRFPNRSAGHWAALRQQALLHSHEWKSIRSVLIQSFGNPAIASVTSTVPVSPFQVTEDSIRQVSNASPLVVPKPEQYQIAKSPQTSRTDSQVDLLWEFQPGVLVAKEAARERGDNEVLQVANETSPNLKRIADSNSPQWSRLLRNGPSTLIAKRTASPPRLDGILNDPCWESSMPLDHSSVRTRIAYDEDFIYIALQSHASNLQDEKAVSASAEISRDHDLTGADRIQFRIDTDRDLLTSMQLQISGSGRTHDAIDGNARWQPTWYLDTRRENTLVTIEIAIERRDIVDLPITAGSSWFISPQVRPSGEPHPVDVLPNPQHWVSVLFK